MTAKTLRTIALVLWLGLSLLILLSGDVGDFGWFMLGALWGVYLTVSSNAKALVRE